MEEEKFSPEKLQKIWDEYAKIYDKLQIVPMYKNLANILVSSLVTCPEGLIHDGGCGTGHYLKHVLEKTKAKKIIATDISSEMIKKAKEKVKNMPKEYQDKVEFLQIDLTKNWPNKVFDIQIFQFLNYLPEDKWKTVIDMAYGSTKQGGYVYFSTLIKGTNMKRLSRSHTLEQILGISFLDLITSIGSILKATKIVGVIDNYVDKGYIILPSREDIMGYCKKVGFSKLEIVGEAIWGYSPVFKLKK